MIGEGLSTAAICLLGGEGERGAAIDTTLLPTERVTQRDGRKRSYGHVRLADRCYAFALPHI